MTPAKPYKAKAHWQPNSSRAHGADACSDSDSENPGWRCKPRIAVGQRMKSIECATTCSDNSEPHSHKTFGTAPCKLASRRRIYAIVPGVAPSSANPHRMQHKTSATHPTCSDVAADQHTHAGHDVSERMHARKPVFEKQSA